MSHLSPDQLSAYIDGALADTDREEAERHFATCAECLQELSEMARVHRQLESTLTHDPGEAYFESFAGRVQERIRSDSVLVQAARPGTKPRRGAGFLDRLSGWLSGPRLAWAGTAAAVIIGAGVVFMVSRQAPIRSPGSADLEARSGQVAGRAESTPSPATVPLAKRENAPPPGGLEELSAESAPTEADGDDALKLGESKETDRLAAGARADQAVVAPAPADERAGAPPRPAATGSLFAAPPPAAGKTSTAPLVSQEKAEIEKNRAREMQRLEGESVAVPEATAQKGAPPPSSGMANEAAPHKDAAARAKTQQARQAAEPLQSSSATRVCGTVRDDSGRPVSGAQVVIADLGVTARSDASGGFCVDAPAGEHTLAVMAVGFAESRRNVEVGTRTPTVDFTLAAVSVLADAKRTQWPEPARDLAADAERGTSRAITTNTAASWDSVALLWSKTAAALPAGEAQIQARASLAEARYRAWKLSPTPGRTGVAAAALQSYLEVVPQGAARRKAQQRLDEVEQR